MIEKLYDKYFQKSKSFLYPALGIKRKGYAAPINTYLSLEGLIGAEECKLICVFKKDSSDRWKEFEKNMIINNSLYEKTIENDENNIYVFNLDIYCNDYFNVIMGKYSRLSNVLKKAIKDFYGEKSSEYSYIQTYLYPEKFYEVYAKLLDVEETTIQKIGELCDPCDLEKETLKLSEENLEIKKETI